MTKKDAAIETYSVDKIYVLGEDLAKSILGRIQQIEQARAALLQEIIKQLKAACGPGEDAVAKAAGLIVALQDGHNLNASARSIRSFLERTAEMDKDHRDLDRFGRTLMKTAVYELTWDEADRFGL